MKKLIPVLLLTILFLPFSLTGQSHDIDSLRQVLKTEKEDTSKVNTLNTLSKITEALGDYNLSFAYADSALILAKQTGYKKGLAIALKSIGIFYDDRANYPLALESYFKALNIEQETGNKSGIAANLGNIGIIYVHEGSLSKGLEYYFKALDINQKIGNKVSTASNLGNIGSVYDAQGNYPNALEYDFKALDIFQEIKNKRGIARTLCNIGNVYTVQGNYTESMEYYSKALAINREIGSKEGIALNLNNIGETCIFSKNYTMAKVYLDSTLNLAKNIGDKDVIQATYNSLAKLDSITGNFKQSLEDFKNCIIYRDSQVNEDATKKTVQAEMNYEFKRKTDSTNAEQEIKDKMAWADKRRQNAITWSVAGGLALVLLFAGFVFRSLRITRKQKQNIETKNIIIEEKNKDILDSITYAKRLQDAILPPLSVIKKYFPESFVLYKPKDIVAGDFYWMERMGDTILIAAADCTGHGVPGAMVSVVCSNALNRALNEFKMNETGKLLDKTRELVLTTFEKSESEVQDGMDISFCAINLKESRLEWSGANNPLLYIRNGEMKEIQPDKQPIGRQQNPKPFNTHSVKLQKGDTLYLFTDGYADQFGGPKGKKFKYKQFQEKLLSLVSMNMDEQKQILNETLENWKGKLEQVDDVLVIGIRV